MRYYVTKGLWMEFQQKDPKRQMFGPTWRFANVCHVLLPFGLRVSLRAVISLVPVSAQLLELRPEHLHIAQKNKEQHLEDLDNTVIERT